MDNQAGKNSGTLYLVATPIGNLEDITLRAIRILQEADVIACEDTRQTLKLLNHMGIKKPLVSYYEHNKITKGNFLIEKLKSGENIVLVSDAGTPGISDPGEDLVRLCIENAVPVTMCPGPVAAVTALVLSGQATGRFVFEGFLPVNKKSRREHLALIKSEERTIILYEAPHKLKYTLKDLLDTLGDRELSLCRELTKKFEEIKRGRISDFINEYETASPRGEYVLIIKGAGKNEAAADDPQDNNISVVAAVDKLIAGGLDKKSAVKSVAEAMGLRKGDVYNEYEAYLRDNNSN